MYIKILAFFLFLFDTVVSSDGYEICSYCELAPSAWFLHFEIAINKTNEWKWEGFISSPVKISNYMYVYP